MDTYYNIEIHGMNYDDNLYNVMKAKDAFIYYSGSFLSSFDNSCELIKQIWFRNVPSSMLLKKGSPYKEIFNHK